MSHVVTGPAIAVEGLRVVRGSRVALDGASLSVPADRVVGLLGPSGSGKSTLLRAVVGVQVVESGAVRVLGLPAGSPELRRRVGYMTQAPSLYADLTVRENLRYFGRVLGVPDGRVDEVIATVALEAEADRVLVRLSGGQEARASLAAALIGAPEVLVLDEPTVGLDPVLRRELWRTFRALAEGGTTVLVSSHVMEEAAHCDELLLLREGKLLATGTVALVTLLKYLFVDRAVVFDRIGGPLLDLFPFIAMFLVTSITMLRERTSGTLERLMTMPLAKLDLLLGYGLAFALVGAVQATLVRDQPAALLGLEQQERKQRRPLRKR